MKPVTVAALYNSESFFAGMLKALENLESVETVFVARPDGAGLELPGRPFIARADFQSSQTIEAILDRLETEFLVILPTDANVSIDNRGMNDMLEAARSARAGMTYCDFYTVGKGEKLIHPLNDYQPGSVRDNFDFGPLMLFSVDAVRAALKRSGSLMKSEFAALYDMRLKISLEAPVHHVPGAVFSVLAQEDGKRGGENLFAYVDPCNASAQKEMEIVFTDYLKRIDAYLSPQQYRQIGQAEAVSFPVEASVIIPVRNRSGTIADAVKSALSQKTDFEFNVIVVDNHSTDGTTDVLARLAKENRLLQHIVPRRTDLGIGGCWNEALYSDACGRYAVQLDSDDLYSGPHTLQQIVDMLRTGRYGMVIGSYTLVDFDYNEIPPGLVDHKEWTDENGRNNALRINGLGAPRAFDTALMRNAGFLNVSYGEDYAAALRMCRDYRIGRIYESLYLCRRWPGNTDAALSIEQANRNDAFKDKIRTDEIAARQRINRGE